MMNMELTNPRPRPRSNSLLVVISVFLLFAILVLPTNAAKKGKKPSIEMAQMFSKWGTYTEIDSALDVLAKKMNEKVILPADADSFSSSKKKSKKQKPMEVMAKIVNIGKSAEKRNLRILTLGRQPSKDFKPKRGEEPPRPPETQLMLMGTMHGREWISPHSILFVAWRLVEEYFNNNPKVQALLDNGLVHVFPFLNPDGYEFTRLGKTDTAKLWRKNRRNLCSGSVKCAHGVDLNRNWGVDKVSWGFGAAKATTEVFQGKRPFSEPELKAIGAWLKKHGKHINGFFDVHCCSAAILPPFYYKGESQEVIDKEFDTCKKIAHAMKNATPGIKYRRKRREKERSESNTGIGVDWIYGEAGVKNVYIIETRGNEKSHKIEEIFDMEEKQILEVGNELNAGFWALIDTVVNFDEFISDGNAAKSAEDTTEGENTDEETGSEEEEEEEDGEEQQEETPQVEGNVDSDSENNEGGGLNLDSLMQELGGANEEVGLLRGSEAHAAVSAEMEREMMGGSSAAKVESSTSEEKTTSEGNDDQSDPDGEFLTDMNQFQNPSDPDSDSDGLEIGESGKDTAEMEIETEADDVEVDMLGENDVGVESDNSGNSLDDAMADEQAVVDGTEANIQDQVSEVDSEASGADALTEKELGGLRGTAQEENTKTNDELKTEDDEAVGVGSDFSVGDASFEDAFKASASTKEDPIAEMDGATTTDSEAQEDSDSDDDTMERFLGPADVETDSDNDRSDDEENEDDGDPLGSIGGSNEFDSIESSIDKTDEKIKELVARKSWKRHRERLDSANSEADALLGPDFEEIERAKRFEIERRKILTERYHSANASDSSPISSFVVPVFFLGALIIFIAKKWKNRKIPHQD